MVVRCVYASVHITMYHINIVFYIIMFLFSVYVANKDVVKQLPKNTGHLTDSEFIT